MTRCSGLCALLVAILAAAGDRPARAQAELTGVEAAEVREGEAALTVRIDGLVARIETRHIIVNEAKRDTEAIYAFDLPADAAVLGAEVILPDGRRALSSAVDERAAFRFVPDDGMGRGAPDVGLLRLLDVKEDVAMARYELRVYPVLAGRSLTAILRWVAPLRYRDGRLTLRVPDRGGAPNLVRERIELAWKAPWGARGLRDIRSGASRLATSTGPVSPLLRFHAPAGSDLVVEATPLFRPDQGLIAELAVTPLDGRRGAVALSLLSPALAPRPASAFERLILVVDRSRSLGTNGLAAARAICDAILGTANPGASADAIVFDRRARAVVGRLSQDRAAVRAGLTKALATEARESGSDLGTALSQVADLLRREGPAAEAPVGAIARGLTSPTIIVILTDGMLPLELDGDRARSQVGTLALAEARVASVILVPDGAAAPDLEHGALADLARATGGRVLAVRNSDAPARAARLWWEIGQPAPYDRLHIDWRKHVITSDSSAPARLESGEAFLLIGWYHGARPGPIAVQAELRGRMTVARVRSAGGGLARAALPLALVQRPEAELLPPAALDGEGAEERARAELVGAAHRAGVATRSTALVLLDPKDAFARDRLAFASKWGTGQYRRFPPPAERRLGEVQGVPPEHGQPRPSGVVGRAAARRTGELDRALVGRLMKQHVVPRARACYQRALLRDPGLTGTVVIELEMARGEVQHARVATATMTSPVLNGCLLDIAYATPVPQVALGDTSEAIVVARYPLRFRSLEKRIDVSPTEDRPSTGTPDPDDPFGGLGN